MRRLSTRKVEAKASRRRPIPALRDIVLVDVYRFEQDERGDWWRSGRDGSARRLVTCTEGRLLAALIDARGRIARGC